MYLYVIDFKTFKINLNIHLVIKSNKQLHLLPKISYYITFYNYLISIIYIVS